MIRRSKDVSKGRTKVVLAVTLIVALAGLVVAGLATSFGVLRRMWRDQYRISDCDLDVVITSNKQPQNRMVSPDAITMSFGLTNGANLATIPFGDIRQRLLQRIPNIQDIRIARSLPSRVRIDVVEREPAVRIASHKGRPDTGRVADYEGVVFPMFSNISALPVVREPADAATKPGQRLAGRAAAALRLLKEASVPAFSGLSILEVETSAKDYLLATLGDYSRAQIAWKDMDHDTQVSRTSLTNQLSRLSQAIATRVISQPTLWIATDYGTPGRVYGKDPTRTAGK